MTDAARIALTEIKKPIEWDDNPFDHYTDVEIGIIIDRAIEASTYELRAKLADLRGALNFAQSGQEKMLSELQASRNAGAFAQARIRDLEATVTTLSKGVATRPLTCRDCPAPYDDKDGWCDVVIPDEIWNAICPEGGVLCFRCMTKRLIAHGYDCLHPVPAIIASGPYKDANEEWRLIGWKHGHKVGLAEALAAQPEPAEAATEREVPRG